MSFNELGLDPSICRALNDAGYTTPTSIQARAIPKLLLKQDVIASADTGTGKTAAFMLPALHHLMQPSTGKGKGPRVLVLTPTRELATQVTASARTYGKHIERIRTVSILGGVPYDKQQRDLKNYVDILVATPGRLLDHHRAGRIDFGRLELLILDEADRMLDMGFQDDVQTIINAMKGERQTVLFSATLGKDIMALANSITKSPERIEIEKSGHTHDQITQRVLYTDGDAHKRKLLHAIIEKDNAGQVIIFTATKRGADDLSEYLYDAGVAAIALHGDMRQSKRLQAIKKVKENKFQVLVATDVAARGIDINGLTHVINYDIPRTAEDYTHRIGRTGRASAEGTAITFVGHRERGQLKTMERFLGHEIELHCIPGLEATQKPMGGNGGGSSRGRSNNRRSGGGSFNRNQQSGGRGGRSGGGYQGQHQARAADAPRTGGNRSGGNDRRSPSGNDRRPSGANNDRRPSSSGGGDRGRSRRAR